MGRNPTLKRIFLKFPIMAHKRGSNVAQQIVRAKLPKLEIFPGPDPLEPMSVRIKLRFQDRD